MKKSLVLFGILALVALSVMAADAPADFRKDLEQQQARAFNRNAALSFVYEVYFMFDRHVPVDGFLKRLVTKDLNMQFPDSALKNAEDFKKWYKGIGDSIRTQTHTVKSAEVTYGEGKTFGVHVIVHWQAENLKGEYISFVADQTWTLVEEQGTLKIRDYLVKEAGK